MTQYIPFAFWYAAGLVGAYCCWLINNNFNLYLDQKYPTTPKSWRKHPSALGFMLIIIAAWIGPIALLIALCGLVSSSICKY